jgi:hypothetical protein
MTAALWTTVNLDVREDGFGSRRFEWDPHAGRIEVLEVCTALAAPAGEQAIRARAALMPDRQSPFVADVLRVTRARHALTVTSAVPDGVTLADILAALEFGTITATDEALLELARAAIRALAAMHEMVGSPAHGAVTPSHLLLRSDGRVMLTGTVFADALRALQCNREQLWRTFSLALPFSAGLPRFDRRSDVTQLGAVVLAILMRRQLNPYEYPSGIAELAGSTAMRYGCGAPLRGWLLQALQLNTKAMFGSAVDASQAYGTIVPQVSGSREELRRLVRQMSGDAVPAGLPTALPGFAMPRTDFPHLGAN